jgi:Flp pilus assembly pilin Flp
MMKRRTQRFLADQSGSTAIEYSMIGMLIAVVMIVSVTRVGTALPGKLTAVSNNLT